MGQEVRTGMREWDALYAYLPQRWVTALVDLPLVEQRSIQEIRLRRGQPVTVSLPAGERYLSANGLTTLRQSGTFTCSPQELETCFLRFCEESVYAHQEELRQGFLSVCGGIRVGVAGTAVVEKGEVSTFTGVTSLCVRLPRRHRGCAGEILPYIHTSMGLSSALLVGEPSSGKTSLLRDLAASLASAGVRVSVVDERGEMSGVDGLLGCDVLRGLPKAIGIRQAVRCLAPQVVLFDELGGEEEVRAVAACGHAGVAVVASLHGRNPAELERKPMIRRLIEEGIFGRWLFLAGRRSPGVLQGCYEPEVIGNAIAWRVVGGVGRDGPGTVLFPPSVSAG